MRSQNVVGIRLRDPEDVEQEKNLKKENDDSSEPLSQRYLRSYLFFNLLLSFLYSNR